MALTGGCFCGRIRYVAQGKPFNATICHCADCRRATGGPMVGWFTVRPGEFSFVHDEPRHYASSPGVTRSFCSNCGTSLTYRQTKLNEIDVTICTLDDPEAVPPQDHLQTAGQLGWVKLDDGLPTCRSTRHKLHTD